MITRVNSRILRIDPIHDFRDFPGNDQSDGYFHEKFLNL